MRRRQSATAPTFGNLSRDLISIQWFYPSRQSSRQSCLGRAQAAKPYYCGRRHSSEQWLHREGIAARPLEKGRGVDSMLSELESS